MSIKQFILLFKHWAWLLAVGLVVGLLAGFVAARLQEPVYAASTKLLVSREVKNDISSFAGLTNQQLVQTYVQMLKTKTLRDKTAQELGVKISTSQVSVQQMSDTLIIEVTVEYPDADLAAKIANSMVSNLIKESLALQTADFTSRQGILTKQIEQSQANIKALQAEYDQVFEQEYQGQLARIDEQIATIQSEYFDLQAEIATLALSDASADRAKEKEKQMNADQLQALLGIYQEQRASLIIQGIPIQTSRLENIRLAQLQANIDDYRKGYFELHTNLDAVELALQQQTPFAVQIEQAFVPNDPVRPIPLLYTALSGMVGLLLAGVVIVLLESLKTEIHWLAPAAEKTLATEATPALFAAPVAQAALADEETPAVHDISVVETAPATVETPPEATIATVETIVEPETPAVQESPAIQATVDTTQDLKPEQPLVAVKKRTPRKRVGQTAP